MNLAARPLQIAVPYHHPAPLRVLHVEDNPTDAWLASVLIAGDADIELDHVTSLDEAALALECAGGYDVVLLDLCLPHSCGLTTLRTASWWVPGLPIVALSSLTQPQTQVSERIAGCGAVATLPKWPADERLLASTLRAVASSGHAHTGPP